MYLLCLCIEIIVILKLKAYSTSKYRVIAYHIITFIFSFTLVIILAATDSLGQSELETCFISSGSPGEKIDVSLNFLFLFLIFLSYYLIRKQLGCCYAPAFHQLSLVVLTLSITTLISRGITSFIFFSRDESPTQENYTIIIGVCASIL